MSRQCRRYSIEFKQEAVRLVVEQGVPVTTVARDLGVDRTVVRSWTEKAAAGELIGTPAIPRVKPDLEEESRRVSRAGYYDWKARPPAGNGERALVVHIRSIHRESRGTYGSPRVARALRGRGMVTNRKRVAQIMQQEGLQGVPRRRFRGSTTQADAADPVAENLPRRVFSTEAPNEAWVADITYLPTLARWAYLAVLIDLFSRKVVGWAVDDVIDTRLCLRALERAVAARSPEVGLIHHSDRGCQYTSSAYQAALNVHGAVPSMSRKGNCWDNAVAESFFGTLKQELPPTIPGCRSTTFARRSAPTSMASTTQNGCTAPMATGRPSTTSDTSTKPRRNPRPEPQVVRQIGARSRGERRTSPPSRSPLFLRSHPQDRSPQGYLWLRGGACSTYKGHAPSRRSAARVTPAATRPD